MLINRIGVEEDPRAVTALPTRPAGRAAAAGDSIGDLLRAAMAAYTSGATVEPRPLASVARLGVPAGDPAAAGEPVRDVA